MRQKREKKTYGPISEKQKIFLQDKTTDIILLGGGAGGGKSLACLLKNLDGVTDPTFRCTIFRRTQPELKRQGGLIDTSQAIYREFGGVFGKQNLTWTFPSGAKVSFSQIASDDDLGSWQGSQLVRALIDEVCDRWTQKQVLFLLSRLRPMSEDSKIHSQLIMTANPDRSSFMYEWVKFCLDDQGIPVPGTENIVKWMAVLENVVVWADSPEECYELHGKPRGMLYGHKLTAEQVDKLSKADKARLFMPKSFRFIPTGVFDNPYLLPPHNNTYLSSLLAQPIVNQKKFLHGSWTAIEEANGYVKRDWYEIVNYPPDKVVSRVRAWDFAASEPSAANNFNCDWTVGIKMSKDSVGVFYVEDMVRFQARTDKVLRTVASVAAEDGLDECDVLIPRDPGAAGLTANAFYIKTLAEHGVGARSTTISGHAGKLTRFKPFAALSEAKQVRVVKGDWNEAFFLELERWTGERNQHDDIVDATADAATYLLKSLSIPEFTIPVFSQANPVPTI